MLRNPKLQAKIDEAEETLQQVADLTEEALDPELSREKVVAKLKEIAEMVADDEGDGQSGE